MDYLQYAMLKTKLDGLIVKVGFKPCYKWITFNTLNLALVTAKQVSRVLNLVINGLPSIQLYDDEVLEVSY